MSENTINRDDWIELFEEGFTLGSRERRRQPAKRRDSVAEKLEDREGDCPHSGAELDAVQAGFEYGRDNGYPGADVEIEQAANTAYDKSGYAAGLSQWGA